MDGKIMKVPITSFNRYLQDILNNKFDIYLQELQKKFAKYFNVTNQLMQLLVEIHEILEENFPVPQDQDYIDPKLYIHSALNIIQSLVLDYPSCIGNSYCDRFHSSTYEAHQQLKTLMQSISQFTPDRRRAKDLISRKTKTVFQALRMMQLAVEEIQEERNYQHTILGRKEEMYKMLSTRVDDILGKYSDIKKDPYFLNFYSILHFMHQPQKKASSSLKITNLQCFFACLNRAVGIQLRLQSMISSVSQFAQHITQNGKKNLKGQPNEIQLAIKYSGIITKPDFTVRSLAKLNVDEFVDSMKFLENQKNQSYSFIDKSFNGVEFKIILDQWEQLNNELQNAAQKNVIINEWNEEKLKNELISMDIKQFVSQLYDFQSYMVYYQNLCLEFEKLHRDVREILHNKLNVKVELECQDLKKFVIY